MDILTQQQPPQEVRIDSPNHQWKLGDCSPPRKHIAILSQSLGHHGVLTLAFLSPPFSQDQQAQMLQNFVTWRRCDCINDGLLRAASAGN